MNPLINKYLKYCSSIIDIKYFEFLLDYIKKDITDNDLLEKFLKYKT